MRQANTIPNDEALDGMGYAELRDLAVETPLPASGVNERKLRQWLKRFRDGATVLKCPRDTCNYRWPYTGSAMHHTSCPQCQTTVIIDKHTVGEDR